MQNKNLIWLNGIVPTDPMIRKKYGFDLNLIEVDFKPIISSSFISWNPYIVS